MRCRPMNRKRPKWRMVMGDFDALRAESASLFWRNATIFPYGRGGDRQPVRRRRLSPPPLAGGCPAC